MPHLVVFESADKGIFPVEDARPGWDVLCDPLKIVGLETALARREIGLRIDHQLRQIGFIERFDSRGERGVAQNKNGRGVFASDPRRFDRYVETILQPW